MEQKKFEKIDEDKYYIPNCREEGYEGNLKISIDKEKFLVKYICEKM